MRMKMVSWILTENDSFVSSSPHLSSRIMCFYVSRPVLRRGRGWQGGAFSEKTNQIRWDCCLWLWRRNLENIIHHNLWPKLFYSQILCLMGNVVSWQMTPWTLEWAPWRRFGWERLWRPAWRKLAPPFRVLPQPAEKRKTSSHFLDHPRTRRETVNSKNFILSSIILKG